MEKVLIIQTAFIGDVILATPVIEIIISKYPQAIIDILVRKGNESLLDNHPHIRSVKTWDKNSSKYANLFSVIKRIRIERYSQVINLQRFISTGMITLLSGANHTIGFNKNPLSFLFTESKKHRFGSLSSPIHEVQRNASLVLETVDNYIVRPKLYPSENDFLKVKDRHPFITISPGSVWYTKQWPTIKWTEFINRVGAEYRIYLLGGKMDYALCESIINASNHVNIVNKAGHLSFLESAALMKNAKMNFVNDSAPLHLASAVDAPVTAIFCSTSPSFGFIPLSENSSILEYSDKLPCKPCGLHGRKSCPQGHFKCSNIEIERLLERLN